MRAHLFFLLFVVPMVLLGGCEPASRYKAAPLTAAPRAPSAAPNFSVPVHYGWQLTYKQPDIPIVFIDAAGQPAEWTKLPQFWNHLPGPVEGTRTLHLGQSPFGAVLAIAAADHMEIVKIKVPLGLPNPTAYIPTSNPPTFAKWLLGKRLFFDPNWLTAEGGMSCATCHDPARGFTENRPRLVQNESPRAFRMNAPSLINCVYNKHQFWDGRAVALEQVIQRQLSDEAIPEGDQKLEQLPPYTHVWHGIMPRLSRLPGYPQQFQQVFGFEHQTVTVDAVAKALATYMRTILSGNSLYDRASARAGEDQKLTFSHFEPLLTDEVLKILQRENVKKKSVAYELERGYRVFHSQYTQCAVCHRGWNFTDNRFHNISVRESDHLQRPGKENGHFPHLPLGLKDGRLIGAFKTPSLRNLPRTAPYFHDGSRAGVEASIEWYNKGIHDAVNTHLDPVLSAGPLQARQMKLVVEEVDALALFLRALDGEPLPAVITAAPAASAR